MNERFVAVRVKIESQDDPEEHFRWDLFESKGLPTVGLVDGAGNPVAGKVIGVNLSVSDVDPAKFIEILESVK